MNAKDAKKQADMVYAADIAKFQSEKYSIKEAEVEVENAAKEGRYNITLGLGTFSDIKKEATVLILQLFENHFKSLDYQTELKKRQVTVDKFLMDEYSLTISWS